MNNRDTLHLIVQNQFQSTSNPAKHLLIATAQIEEFAIAEIEQEVKNKQLYYHKVAHAQAVKRRANQILEAIAPYYQLQPLQLQKIQCLINICAVSHDMVQDFSPQDSVHTARKREAGKSEAATIDKLLQYIDQLNLKYRQTTSQSSLFTPADIATIRETIRATICLFDTTDQSMYQPSLYGADNQHISLPAKIIALADLGALGIEGIESFLTESSLIFLEENPDIIPLIHRYQAEQHKNKLELDSEFRYLKHRLLQLAQFEVNFAKGRQSRLNRELTIFPPPVRQILTSQVFKYLTPETIQTLEKIMPTDSQTSLKQLLEFFNFSAYLI